MQKQIAVLVLVLLASCGKKEENHTVLHVEKPKVSDNGNLIVFPDKKTADFFAIHDAESEQLFANLTAPARVVATVVPSQENPNQNLVLFDNPDLTSTYTQLLQHLANINQIQ